MNIALTNKSSAILLADFLQLLKDVCIHDIDYPPYKANVYIEKENIIVEANCKCNWRQLKIKFVIGDKGTELDSIKYYQHKKKKDKEEKQRVLNNVRSIIEKELIM